MHDLVDAAANALHATAYTVGNKVRSAGLSYQCTTAHTNHIPPNTSYWKEIDSNWEFQHWAAGDGAAVAAATGAMAQLREFAFQWGRSKIINYAVAGPQYKQVSGGGGPLTDLDLHNQIV